MAEKKLNVIRIMPEDVHKYIKTHPRVKFKVVDPKKGEKYLKILIQYDKGGVWTLNRELEAHDLSAEWLPDTIIHLAQKTWWGYFVGYRLISIAKAQFWTR